MTDPRLVAARRARHANRRPPAVPPSPLQDRIASNVTVTDSGCWQWNRCLSDKGYSRLRVNNKNVYGHRASYEAFVGPIPDGLQIDHLCRNRACVNPEHLEAVTAAVNQHRGPDTIAAINAGRRSCPQGHPYSAQNTYIDPLGRRICRTCRRASLAAFRARRAALRADGAE